MAEQSEVPALETPPQQQKPNESGDTLVRKDTPNSLDSSIFTGERQVPVNWEVQNVSGFVEFMKHQPQGEYIKVGPDNPVFGGAPEAAFGYIEEPDPHAPDKKKRVSHTDTGIILKLPTLKTPESSEYFDKRNHNYGETLAENLRSELSMRKGMPYIISQRSMDSGATDLSFDTGQDGVALYALGESSDPSRASRERMYDKFVTFYDNEGNDERFFIRTNNSIGGEASPSALQARVALVLETWRILENKKQANVERTLGKEFPRSTLVIDASLPMSTEALADKENSSGHENTSEIQVAEQHEEEEASKVADVEGQIKQEEVKQEASVPEGVNALSQKPEQENPEPPDSGKFSRRTVSKGLIGMALGGIAGLFGRKVLAPGVQSGGEKAVAQTAPSTPEATQRPTEAVTEKPSETQTPSPTVTNTATVESTSTLSSTTEPTETASPPSMPTEEATSTPTVEPTEETSTPEPASTETATPESTIQPSKEPTKPATAEPTEVPVSPTPDMDEILKEAKPITITENGTISQSLAMLNGKDITTPEGQKWWKENYWYAVDQLGAFELANYKALKDAFNARRVGSDGQEVADVTASFPDGYPSEKDILHWIEQAKSAIESVGVNANRLPIPYEGKENDLNTIDPLLKLQEALHWVAEGSKLSVPDPKYASAIIAYYSR